MSLDPNVERVKNLRENKEHIAIKKDLESNKHHILQDILIVPKATSYEKNGVNYRLLSLIEACDNFYRITSGLPPWCHIAFNDGKIQYIAENFIIIEGEHYLKQHKVAYMAVTSDNSSREMTKGLNICHHDLPQLIKDGKYKWFKSNKDLSTYCHKSVIVEAEKMAKEESRKSSITRYEYKGVWFDRRHNNNKFPEGHFFNPGEFESNATYFLFKVGKEGNFEDSCNRVWSIGTRLGLHVWGTPAPWYSKYAHSKEENYNWYQKNNIKHVVIFQAGRELKDERKELSKRNIDSTVIAIQDFNIPTIGNIQDLIKVLLNCPRDTRVAMHCSAGKGRTGFMVLTLKKLLSPIDGLDFDNLLEKLGVEYRMGAKSEISLPDTFRPVKEERKYMSDKQMQDKIQKAGGECRYKYFRFVRGQISSTPDDHLALKGSGSWNFVQENRKYGATWNIILALPGETLEAMYVLYRDEGDDTWNSGTAKGLRKFIKRKNPNLPSLNYYECVLPKWSPSTKMIADVKNVDNGLPW